MSVLHHVFREVWIPRQLPEEVAEVGLMPRGDFAYARPSRFGQHYGFALVEEQTVESLDRACELAVSACYMASSWA